MKQILIIGGLKDSEQSEQVFADYIAGASRVLGTGYQVTSTRVNDLDVVIRPGEISIYDRTTSRPLQEYDLIILHGYIRKYRDIAYAVSRFCRMRGVPYFNDLSIYYSGTKVGQAVIFAETGVQIPKTIYAMGADNLANLAQRELELPFILKDASGTKGERNYLVRDLQQLQENLSAWPQIEFIAQEYCPNDRDYRLLLSPKRELVFERRGGADTHLNNTSQGASAAAVPDGLPTEAVVDARRVADRMGLAFAGVDIMPHLQTGELYFIEVNGQPQLFTGALLDQKAEFARDLFLSVIEDSKN